MLHYVLTALQNHFKNYCSVAEQRTGINFYWGLLNNSTVISKLEYLYASSNLNSANSFDFSTLFTMLPHDTVLNQLYYLVDLMFKNNRGKKYMAISLDSCISDQVYWNKTSFYTDGHHRSDKFAYLTAIDIKELIKFNLTNTYIQFGEFTFRQASGISMGGSASPDIANLTLSVLEFRFLKDIANNTEKHKLKYAFRYIDDILILNCSDKEFLDIASKIYPASLPLNHSSGNRVSCNFLDLHIQFLPSLQLSVYDKTQDFNFKVVKFIFASSNVTEQLGYNVLYSQLIRAARISNNRKAFVRFSLQFFSSIQSNGFANNRAKNICRRFCKNHLNLSLKFGISSKWEINSWVYSIFK